VKYYFSADKLQKPSS